MQSKNLWLRFDKKHVGVILTVLLVLALLFVEFFTNLDTYWQCLTVHVDHPLSYSFPVWNQILKDYSHDGLIDYKSLKQSGKINSQVLDLARISPSKFVDENDQLCFWLNSYNILLTKTVLDHYPIRTIRQVEGDLSRRSFVVGGLPYTLESLKAKQILPFLTEQKSLALFLLSDGTMGGPAILPFAATGKFLKTDMAAQAFKYVNDPHNVKIDPDANSIYISPFFKWNEAVLANAAGSTFGFVDSLLPQDKQFDVNDISLKRGYLADYNWWLNDTALKAYAPHNEGN